MANSVHWWLKVRDRGGKLVVIDSRVTQTAMLADLHLQPRPGTDMVLAGAMAHVLIENGWIDGEFIAAYTRGFEAYRQAVAGCTPERAEAITGVPARDIVEAARIYGQAQPAVIDLSRGALGKQRDGWQTIRAIASLVGLCGYTGVPGGGMIWEGDVGLNRRYWLKTAGCRRNIHRITTAKSSAASNGARSIRSWSGAGILSPSGPICLVCGPRWSALG